MGARCGKRGDSRLHPEQWPNMISDLTEDLWWQKNKMQPTAPTTHGMLR